MAVSRGLSLPLIAMSASLPMMTGVAIGAPLTPVQFTDVKLADPFFAPRIDVNRATTVEYCFKYCEDTQRIGNFEVASGAREGQFEGIYFNDSDLYKVIEGAALTLAHEYDEDIDAYLDGLIAKVSAAQQPDGYLNTYYTLVEPDKRWSDLPAMHELYCAGHLFEAAVAHYRATGKTSLLDVATRFADCIDEVFGEEALIGVPGHEEIELALVKLYHSTGEERYLDLARFFIDQRGYSDREYCQDNIPVREQSQVVGHAVRAMYLYCGMADLAAQTGDEALIAALHRLWADVTTRKMYITGGIGPSAHNEGFTTPYDLPNESAYAETCAAIGLALWSHRMLLLHGESVYGDVLERCLYNGMMSGVSLDGSRFFYVNPLASRGGHHRQPWYGCACCPTNVVRFVPQVPGFVYAVRGDELWVNLYVAGQAEVQLEGGQVMIRQETDYPWSGDVALTVEPEATGAKFEVALRIPGWCEGASVEIAGEAIDATPDDSGYVRIRRAWEQGDRIELSLPMPIRRVVANPGVGADRGRVALQRGPVVYCLEGVDNDGSVLDIALPREAELEAEFEADLLNGVVVLRGEGLRRRAQEWSGRLYQGAPVTEVVEITAVPYCTWDNREPGEMVVWLPETPLLAESRLAPTIATEATASASHVHAQDAVAALNDNVNPKNSNDQSIPRFTWWDHRGTEEWVAFEWAEPQRLAAVEVYWFDDTGQGECRVPASWEIEWLDGDEWKPVENAGPRGVAPDQFNRVTFSRVTTRGVRLRVQLEEGFSGGILEWRLPEAATAPGPG